MGFVDDRLAILDLLGRYEDELVKEVDGRWRIPGQGGAARLRRALRLGGSGDSADP
jgi:hypothetical protein